MGAMKYLFLLDQERPDMQERLDLEDLQGLHAEPDFPDTQDFMTEPIEGTVFDPDTPVPF